MPAVKSKNELHEKIMKDNTKWEPPRVGIRNKNMFRHINKVGQYFQDTIYIYMGDFMAHDGARHI